MRQRHTEEAIEHTNDQQSTGNHKRPGMPEVGSTNRFGGTRAGAEKLERPSPAPRVRRAMRDS